MSNVQVNGTHFEDAEVAASSKYTRALKSAYSFVAPYKKQVAIALTALILTAMVTLSIGQGIRLVIDNGFATQSPENLNHSVLIFLVLVLLLSLGTYTRYYWVTWIGERVVTDIRTKVFNHLIHLHPGFFENNRSLEIQSRLTADTTLLQSVIGSSVSVALRNMIMMLGGIVWLFITNPKLTSIVIAAVPVVVFPIILFGRQVRGLSRLSQDRVADVGAYVGEVLGQIKTVQAYSHEQRDKTQFTKVAEQAFDVAKQRIRQRFLLIAIVITLVLGAIGVILWVGGSDVISGEISGGELAAFLFYSIIVGSAVGSVSEIISELQRAAGAMERISELLKSKSLILNRADKDVGNLEQNAEISLRNVSFAYPSRPEVNAVNQLSLVIKPGETVALVGPSGAGKSTLFDLLLRFYEVNEGEIFLGDKNIRDVSLENLRAQFALVSQQPVLFFGSVAENIRYGRPDASEEEMITAAKLAHAHDFIVNLPSGYETKLGDLGLGLSGGQKQRIAIARALLVDAPVLLLDEATSALDAESENLIQKALEPLMKGRTTLVIAHRLATVKTADRIAVIEHGELIAIGKHHELIESNELYAKLARLQFSHDED